MRELDNGMLSVRDILVGGEDRVAEGSAGGDGCLWELEENRVGGRGER